ncbi:ankyrin repeat protein [Colletotrichum plurivorum]|uniref:Ankyrin repeat protein n=1 Tax=Colletotrichum plurivorum TaxID=2175906 RepID=A0A8H6KDF6_9PEZI|nr:ankyrin repeat protein [Colletotrichum plurivorum]
MQNQTDAILATKVVSWVVCTKRRLRIAELQHALAAEEEDQTYEDGILSEEDIVSVCLGLVRIEPNSTVQLAHETAKEFFEAEKDNAEFLSWREY